MSIKERTAALKLNGNVRTSRGNISAADKNQSAQLRYPATHTLEPTQSQPSEGNHSSTLLTVVRKNETRNPERAVASVLRSAGTGTNAGTAMVSPRHLHSSVQQVSLSEDSENQSFASGATIATFETPKTGKRSTLSSRPPVKHDASCHSAIPDVHAPAGSIKERLAMFQKSNPGKTLVPITRLNKPKDIEAGSKCDQTGSNLPNRGVQDEAIPDCSDIPDFQYDAMRLTTEKFLKAEAEKADTHPTTENEIIDPKATGIREQIFQAVRQRFGKDDNTLNRATMASASKAADKAICSPGGTGAAIAHAASCIGSNPGQTTNVDNQEDEEDEIEIISVIE